MHKNIVGFVLLIQGGLDWSAPSFIKVTGDSASLPVGDRFRFLRFSCIARPFHALLGCRPSLPISAPLQNLHLHFQCCSLAAFCCVCVCVCVADACLHMWSLALFLPKIHQRLLAGLPVDV